MQKEAPGARSGQIIVVGQGFVRSLHETSHLQDDSQSTLPHADVISPPPVHVAWHSPVPQVSGPHAASPPEQSARHRPVVHEIAPHALLPAHVASQSPVVQLIVPHAALPLPPEQLAVQSPVVQPMLPHAFTPTHVTSQSRVLHVMARHAPSAVQSTSHDSALVQQIAPHAPLVSHRILQFQPLGQVMSSPPEPTIVHDRVWKLHVSPQMLGHTAASEGPASTSGFCPITQNPCVHTRSAVQSALVSHVKLSETRCTEQLQSSAASAVPSSVPSAAGFTSGLRARA